MSIIYEPKGAAREYSALACNLYSGCQHGCKYCYVPGTPPWKFNDNARLAFHCSSTPRKDVLRKLAREAAVLRGDPREILFCFTCDPYQVGRDNSITSRALDICACDKLKVQILTKGGMCAAPDFPLMAEMGAKFATTLLFSKDDERKQWEPNAASVEDRIQAIKLAHSLGVNTWVSVEPVIDPDQALTIIGSLSDHVDFWKIGKINHCPEVETFVDWRKFYRDVSTLLSGRPHLIKEALRKYA